jgi:hypothetical protein
LKKSKEKHFSHSGQDEAEPKLIFGAGTVDKLEEGANFGGEEEACCQIAR